MRLSCRPLDPDADAERIAALMREYGFDRAAAAGMRSHLTTTRRQTRRTTVAVEGPGPEGAGSGASETRAAGGGIVGYADVYRQEGMTPGAFLLFLLVAPARRRRGIGGRLYDDAVGFAAAYGLREVRVPAWDTDPESLAFAARRGFVPEYLIVSSRLDAGAFDEPRFAPVVDQVRAQGLRLFSLSEVPDTPENWRRLHALYRETWLDAPDGAGWVERMTEEFAPPMFRPEAARGLYLAADGDEWVGFTHLNYDADPRYARQAMTGVRRAYRGRKVAQALKVMAIAEARARGVVEIATGNDSRNAPMLAINRKLGFVPGRGQYSLLKRFPP